MSEWTGGQFGEIKSHVLCWQIRSVGPDLEFMSQLAESEVAREAELY